MNAARRARQKARKQEALVTAPDGDDTSWYESGGFPPGTFQQRKDVTVTAGVASASGSATPEQKD